VPDEGPRTSESSPLRVDWVPLGRVPGLARAAGRLGMTFLPGKQWVSLRGVSWHRDLETDLARLKGDLRVEALLLLVEDHELVRAGVPRLADACAAHGIELLRFPIGDGGVPADRAAFRARLDDIRSRVFGGQSVAVACMGGCGRTGTTVACLLVDAGLEAGTAIDMVREVRPCALETPAQEAFVRAWC
jgi:ADP-ribosyl-[dinitrogen reductase] hydrolase